MSNNNLPSEITRLIELGINTHINRTFFYSPLKLMLNLFKKRNTNLVEQVRQNVSNDISILLSKIDGFENEIFFNHGAITQPGKQLLKTSYNIGIKLMKYKLNLRLSFMALRDKKLQQEIYNYILEEIKKAASNHINSSQIEQQT